MLAQFEGRSEAPVTLVEVELGKGEARWTEGAVPRVVAFDTEGRPVSQERLNALTQEFVATSHGISTPTNNDTTYLLEHLNPRMNRLIQIQEKAVSQLTIGIVFG